MVGPTTVLGTFAQSGIMSFPLAKPFIIPDLQLVVCGLVGGLVGLGLWATGITVAMILEDNTTMDYNECLFTVIRAG